jgi:hypothetical protein
MVKKLLTYFFVTLGVIFFFILIGLAYLWFADPFGIRPVIDAFTKPQVETQTETTTLPKGASGVDTSLDKNPALTSEQEQALESIGIDPASIPSTISPEMEACFVAILGEARVEAIKDGATPTPIEAIKTKECY